MNAKYIKKYRLLFLGSIFLFKISTSLADAPPAALGPGQICSYNSRWCIDSQEIMSHSSEVRVYDRKSNPRGLWVVPHRFIGRPAITDSGQCVVDMVAGTQRIPLTAKPTDVAVAFYCRGDVAFKYLALTKFIDDINSLPQSASHKDWAEFVRIADQDRLFVKTTEGRSFTIDLHNGALINGNYAH